MNKVLPTQNESPFGFHEFFFSTTNPRGVIRYGNDVFVRVSFYPKEKILGAPHSLIRHPDMPRSVFKVFWDMLKANKAIAAYVKNMAANGSFYWVLAFAFPIENGYLSIRFKPSSDIFKVVQAIYQDVKTFETQGGSLETSEELLLQKIQSHGFKNYEDFMVKAVIAELRSRELKARETQHEKQEVQKTDRSPISDSGAKAIAQSAQKTLSTLKQILEWAEGFQQANKVITETVTTLEQGFRNLKFISLNMTITAAKFGAMAAGLGVVSLEFSNLSEEIEAQLKILDGFAEKLSGTVAQSTFRISALNSQMLMVDFFVQKALQNMQSSDNAFAEMNENKKDFSSLFHHYATKMREEIASLSYDTANIKSTLEEVRRSVTGLEVIRQMGGIESARVGEIKSTFNHYLNEMNEFILLLRQSTTNVSNEVEGLKSRCESIVNSASKITGDVQQIFDLATKFTPR